MVRVDIDDAMVRQACRDAVNSLPDLAPKGVLESETPRVSMIERIAGHATGIFVGAIPHPLACDRSRTKGAGAADDPVKRGRLYQGRATDSDTTPHEMIRELCPRVVVSCVDYKTSWTLPREVAHHMFEGKDGDIDILPHFPRVCNLIQKAIEQNQTVLLISRRGISRSVTWVAAYYLWRDPTRTVQDVVRYIQTKRKCAMPNIYLLKQLFLYRAALNKAVMVQLGRSLPHTAWVHPAIDSRGYKTEGPRGRGIPRPGAVPARSDEGYSTGSPSRRRHLPSQPGPGEARSRTTQPFGLGLPAKRTPSRSRDEEASTDVSGEEPAEATNGAGLGIEPVEEGEDTPSFEDQTGYDSSTEGRGETDAEVPYRPPDAPPDDDREPLSATTCEFDEEDLEYAAGLDWQDECGQ